MFLVPVMLILVVMGILLFSWAVKNGQYDDLEGPAHRILYDDDKDMIPEDARTDKPEPPEGPSGEEKQRPEDESRRS
ncbi:MAG: cbb3-type cytochrome oxidase maturation protein [Marinobacter maritimus]|jgi:cbb3-type cytochrome oxidase maturation protein|uniref:cbb3-type cytochrome oxidase assembly protein CcoS n=1 Tax=Marinobacter maritimus TaxID=277961 RepID=UPI003ADAEEF5|tara:strand:- start:207 stop:437 length:231 start_codon:yes stop_codon:yes gene_type:complete